eukprot:CAMPEP_0117659414 /NCGR_PEP_ID=MMETSP0804-20121206/6420_1 /TAXON_ID=1074897 /ORGANISM="Tetraselmis astigmatica, Strain CCMP880" /LENGTH=751 /DNA_ID=CAMNT_0005466071 /DNA_START=30 /DNA_END=2284 /DNA_ORIENTATION=-
MEQQAVDSDGQDWGSLDFAAFEKELAQQLRLQEPPPQSRPANAQQPIQRLYNPPGQPLDGGWSEPPMQQQQQQHSLHHPQQPQQFPGMPPPRPGDPRVPYMPPSVPPYTFQTWQGGGGHQVAGNSGEMLLRMLQKGGEVRQAAGMGSAGPPPPIGTPSSAGQQWERVQPPQRLPAGQPGGPHVQLGGLGLWPGGSTWGPARGEAPGGSWALQSSQAYVAPPSPGAAPQQQQQRTPAFLQADGATVNPQPSAPQRSVLLAPPGFPPGGSPGALAAPPGSYGPPGGPNARAMTAPWPGMLPETALLQRQLHQHQQLQQQLQLQQQHQQVAAASLDLLEMLNQVAPGALRQGGAAPGAAIQPLSQQQQQSAEGQQASSNHRMPPPPPLQLPPPREGQKGNSNKKGGKCGHGMLKGNKEDITAGLMEIVEQITPTQEEIAKQKECFGIVTEALKAQWPQCKVHLFGSCANTLSVRNNNDLDISLELKEAGDDYGKKADAVEKMGELLEEARMAEVIALSHARVPVVKFVHPVTGTKCDVTVNNHLACINTKLLFDYASVDPRMRQLVFVVKNWAKKREVNEAYQGTLSSYAYVLMCIHLLQNRNPPILPCLQAIKPPTFQRTVAGKCCDYFDDISQLKGFGKTNTETLAELVWAFFEFWAWRHDYNNAVISIRTAGFFSKNEKGWTRRVGSERHLICIEDPFEITHDLGRVVDRNTIGVLRKEFERAARILQDNANPLPQLFEPFQAKKQQQQHK